MRKLFALFMGLAAFIYLLCPSLLPDWLPFVGWLDEGIATTILIGALSQFGIDLTNIFGGKKTNSSKKALHSTDAE